MVEAQFLTLVHIKFKVKISEKEKQSKKIKGVLFQKTNNEKKI